MKLILIVFLTVSLYADIKHKMLNLYKTKKYEQACNIGFDYYKQNKNDEEYVLLYAFSCLKSDYIDRLALPITQLKFLPETRANSAYFSVILMQKRLLYHALLDDYDVSSLKLPTTNHILSKVFDLYGEADNSKKQEQYIFQDKTDKKTTYKLYLEKNDKLDKIVIEEFYNSKLIKQHIYW